MADLRFSCRCGEVAGQLRDVGPKLTQGIHCRCKCRSCRAARLYLNEPDPAPEGVDLYQTSPDRIAIARGKDRLAGFQITEGLVSRWYATCCKSTLFTTSINPKVPAMSVAIERIEGADALGPVRATAFGQDANGKTRHDNLLLFVGSLITRQPGYLLGRRYRAHPLFDGQSGQPITPVTRLTDQERTAFPGF